MIVNLEFNLEAWVKKLTMYANSEEDAINKLKSMTLAEILEEDVTVDSEIKFTDISTTVTGYDVVTKVSNIKYDLDPDAIDASVIEYLKNLLPKELTITLEEVTDTDDISELIREALFSETNYDVESFDYKIIEKK